MKCVPTDFAEHVSFNLLYKPYFSYLIVHGQSLSLDPVEVPESNYYFFNKTSPSLLLDSQRTASLRLCL